MIKKILFGLSVCVLGFMGFSSASKIQSVGLDSSPSAYDSSFNLTFLKGGGLLSSFLGQSKSIIALKDNVFFWWATNGQPYYYDQGIVQGFFGQYFLCDPLTGLDSSINNCSEYPITGEYQAIFKSFFEHVVQGDYVFYDYEPASSDFYHDNTIQICFSSENFNKSLCFRQHDCYNGQGCSRYNYGSLINSEYLSNLSFGLINYNWIGYAPGQKGYGGGGNIEGSSNTVVNSELTGNVLYNTCSNGYVLSQLDKYYGSSRIRYSCNAGLYDTGLIVGTGNIPIYSLGQGIDYKEVYKLTDLYSPHQSWSNWFNEFSTAMYNYKLGRYGPNGNPFLSYPVVLYTYFEILYDQGFTSDDSYDILNYCNLYLYSDYNEEYKGSYFKSYCNGLDYDSGIFGITTGEVGDIDDDEILPPGFDDGGSDVSSSGVVVSVDWSGTLSGETNVNMDGKNFINDFYQKLQSNYMKPYNGLVGIVPMYILVFLCALILFRFLQH